MTHSLPMGSRANHQNQFSRRYQHAGLGQAHSSENLASIYQRSLRGSWSSPPAGKLLGHLQLVKYIVNGLFATLIQFLTLKMCIELLEIPSAGLSNIIGSIFGISASFFGNRLFAFPESTETLSKQATNFLFLYTLIALLNGVILYLWSDVFSAPYQIGFIFARIPQFLLSYFGNKFIVFRKYPAQTHITD